jgi:hypothetical protein
MLWMQSAETGIGTRISKDRIHLLAYQDKDAWKPAAAHVAAPLECPDSHLREIPPGDDGCEGQLRKRS